MQLRTVAIASVACASLLAACGGSSGNGGNASGPTTANTGPTSTVHVAKEASNTPSISAKMICEPEAINDIYNSATGVKTIAPMKPTWVGHVYSCDYVYPHGAVMRLSVKEMSSTEETTAYYDQLAQQLGKADHQPTLGLGQGAFVTKNGSLVVRKDYKVLLIDVSKLPQQFGVPADSRGNVAINVGVAVMGCWTGA